MDSTQDTNDSTEHFENMSRSNDGTWEHEGQYDVNEYYVDINNKAINATINTYTKEMYWCEVVVFRESGTIDITEDGITEYQKEG